MLHLVHRTTTNQSIGADLARSLKARFGVPVGPTFGDFIKACRELGIQDEDDFSSVEYGVSQCGSGLLTAELDEHGGYEVREITR